MDYTEWINGIFNCSPIDEFELDWSEEFWAATGNLPADDVVRLITETFLNSGKDLQNFSNIQIAMGIKFICNELYDPFRQLSNPEVPVLERQNAIKSIETLYRDCFAVRCTNSYIEYHEPVDTTCYMFWDVCAIYAGSFTQDNEDDRRTLIEAIVDVLVRSLSIPNVACQVSALHGIGHTILHLRYNMVGTFSKQMVQKMERAVDKFLSRSDLPTELRDYAEQARTGDVN